MKTARTDCGAGTRPMMDVLIREVVARMDAAAVAGADKRLSALQLSEVVTACALACYHPGDSLLQTTLREATAHMQELPTQAGCPLCLGRFTSVGAQCVGELQWMPAQ